MSKYFRIEDELIKTNRWIQYYSELRRKHLLNSRQELKLGGWLMWKDYLLLGFVRREDWKTYEI